MKNFNKTLTAITLLSLLPLLSLLKPGMFVAHDSVSHIARVASFYQSLTEGNLFPRWSQGLNAGYGHPIFMFLYPLSSYLSAAFHFFGFNFASSIKLVLASSFISSGIFMYLWLKKHFSANAALLGSLVWQFAPYRFLDLYVRNALGEHTAFAFVPLVLLAVNLLVTKPSLKRTVFTSAGLAALILAHNAVSLMFIPFIAVYAFILLYSLHKKTPQFLRTTSYLLLAGLLGLTLSAFFWLPALIEGKYTLRAIVMQEDGFAANFPSFKQLVIPNWGYGVSDPGITDDLSFNIGLIQWLAFITGTTLLVGRFKKLKTERNFVALASVTFIFTTFLLLKQSLPIWHLLTILKKFQFPWRLLILPVFSASILAGFTVDLIKPKKIILFAGLTATILLTFSYWHPRGDYLLPEKTLIKQYLGTTDTGESTPLWAIRFQEKRPKDVLEVVWGAPITYQVIRRESEIHEYNINAQVKTQVADNTLYFPGWTVYVDDEKVPIIFDDQNWRGVITYPVPEGTHDVKVIFEETKLRKLANASTVFSLLIIIGLFIYPKLAKGKQ